jgi:hypothetical protein
VTENRYLLDNNALVRLSLAQRSAPLVRTSCRIPSEILWEARGLPDHTDLHRLEYPMTPSVAAWLKTVMAAIPGDSVNVIDLYRNKGNGDPLLIAVALDARDEAEQTLLPEKWHIVTDDHGLAGLATVFDVPTLHTADFACALE